MNIVSAWVSEQSVVLGQVKCEAKSNESTAIPELLKILHLAGGIVTIDAMGCQKEIIDTCLTREKEHGRSEERRCWVTEEIAWLEQKEEWEKLKSVILVEAVGEVSGKEKSLERRYFISSLGANAALALRAVRGHWAIENELHWCIGYWLSRR